MDEEIMKELLKTYFPKSIIGVIILIIIYFLVGYVFGDVLYFNAIFSIIVFCILNEIRLFLKYRNFDKNTVLIIIKSRDINVFNNIKAEIEEKIEKVIVDSGLEKPLKVKFIDDYIYNQRICNMQKNKYLNFFYNYHMCSILSVNETTKKGKKFISVTPQIKIDNNIDKETDMTESNSVVKRFTEEIINNSQLLDKENLFDDINDLSSNLFLCICFISGIYYPIQNYTANSFEYSRKIFHNAFFYCRTKENIGKKNKKIYEKYKKLFAKLKNLAIVFEIDLMLDYSEIKNKLEINSSNNILDIIEVKNIEKLLDELRGYRHEFLRYFSYLEIIEFFKKTNYVKINHIFEEHKEYLKRYCQNKDEYFVYYLNRAFIELYYKKIDISFSLYQKALDMYNNGRIPEEILTDMLIEIDIFFSILEITEKNIFFNMASCIIDKFKATSEFGQQKYDELLKSCEYLELPAIIREKFEKFN